MYLRSSCSSIFATTALGLALLAGCGLQKKDKAVPESDPIADTAPVNPEAGTNLDAEPTSEPFTSSSSSSPAAAAEDCLTRSEKRLLGLKDTQPSRPAERPDLSATFVRNCASCHGKSGEGNSNFPDIRNVSYQNFSFSVRSGRAGIMPAFSEEKYPKDILELDYFALTGKDIPVPELKPCPIDKSGYNPEIAPAIAYQTESTGPKARGLGFALDPFVLPYVMCKELPVPGEGLQTKRVCANVGISGSTEPGYRFADFGVCKDIRTQRPYRSIEVKVRNGHSDADADARLKDPKFATELAWVTDQIRSSGCVCCHDSSVDKRASFWDISKNKVWTDQLDKYAVEIFTGRVDSTALGAYQPDANFGFDRLHTGLPTTDVPRMQAFFKGLASDLGTTDEEIATMPPLADFLASQLREEPKQCEKGVGVDAKTGKITWKAKILDQFPAGIVPARFIYVLEEDAQTPLVTPNLDKPIGTLWRLEAPSFLQGFLSNTVRYGEVRKKNAVQTIPDPERFGKPKALVPGRIYRLVVQLDVAFPLTNCLFTFGETL
jgi:cytochrome c553